MSDEEIERIATLIAEKLATNEKFREGLADAFVNMPIFQSPQRSDGWSL